jgi:tetratricopeptide (TPR) repeat protein
VVRARSLGLALVLAACAWGSPAAAEDDKDRARDFARKALDEIDAGDFEAAYGHASEAERLYHAPVHLEAMGAALEGLGRLAEAADIYERLVAEPVPPSAPQVFRDAQEHAKKRLAELGAKVPSLLIRMRGAPVEKIRVTVDDRELSYVEGLARRVDPGTRVLRVEADGMEPHEETVELPSKGGVVTIDVSLRASGTEAPPSETPTPVESSEGSLVPAFVAFGVGAAALGVGAITGALALGTAGDLDERCPDKQCTAADQDDYDSAVTMGTVSTIGFVVAGVAIAAGVVLFAVRPGGSAGAQAGAPVEITVGWGRLGARGAF